MGVDRLADSRVGEHGAAEITGEKNRSQDRGLRDEVDHQAEQLERAQRPNQGLRQLKMLHSLHDFGMEHQLHPGAQGEEGRDQNR
jgi:hypothetical protein